MAYLFGSFFEHQTITRNTRTDHASPHWWRSMPLFNSCKFADLALHELCEIYSKYFSPPVWCCTVVVLSLKCSSLSEWCNITEFCLPEWSSSSSRISDCSKGRCQHSNGGWLFMFYVHCWDSLDFITMRSMDTSNFPAWQLTQDNCGWKFCHLE